MGARVTRTTGIEALAEVGWGSHLCVFYRNRQELLELVVPYIRAGLESNEYCVWIVSAGLSVDEAEALLVEAIPGYAHFRERGAMTLVSYAEMYLTNGQLDTEAALAAAERLCAVGRSRGFDGTRICGAADWLDACMHGDFMAYEAQVHEAIGALPLIAMCAYPLDQYGLRGVIEATQRHHATLVRQDDGWELLESPDRRKVEAALRDTAERLEEAERIAGQGSWDLDLASGNIQWSSGLYRLLGYRPGSVELSYASVVRLIPEADRAQVVAAVEQAIENREDYRLEHGMLRADGTALTVQVSARLYCDAEGRPVRLAGALFDITERKRMEEALRDSEARARRHLAEIEVIYRSAPVGLCVLDTALNVRRINDRLAQMCARSNRGCLGKPLRQLMPAFGKRLEPLLHEVVATGQPVSRLELGEEDGSRVWITHWSALRDVDGSVKGINGVFKDITEHKRTEQALRESEGKYRHLWENLNDAAFIADASSGYLLETNKQGERLLGRDRDEIVGLHQRELHPPGKAAEYRQRFANHVARGRAADYDGEVIRKDGAIVPVHISAAPINFDERALILGLFRDITERKRTEQALRSSEARLRDQAELLEAADRRKDEFLAILSHELRNPLAAISNALQLMRRHKGDGALQDGMLGVAERQLGQLVRLVDDLLDITRVTRGVVTLERVWVSVCEVLRDAVETASPHIESGGHALRVDCPEDGVAVFGDRLRLAQAVANLLINAAKYTEPGGYIEVSVLRAGNGLSIAVRDNGIGIAAEMLPDIFDLFIQSPQSGRSQGGLGIGLALVKSLVELHGGAVTAESSGLGQGSTFTLRLPVDGPDVVELLATEGPGPVALQRVLVVDDTVDVADSMALLLRSAGHQVFIAYDGPRALALARTCRPQLVLLDIGMPGMDGYEVAGALRRQPESRGALLIAVTGWGDALDRQRSCAAGFDHHLVKPIGLADVEALVAARPLTTPRAADA